ncbi:phospholipase D family protein [Vibrio cholerae]|uniref:phospholipase D family protein n=1 Tax=Vibrio cholerae TaxID=666 RepID=UPI002738AC08|nr:phospholipase D family protein [Vibrio cholerae]MDP4497655.1 phospholipase D family protein [Vibrio cholerae]MDP4497682.1 phospholipase D family protein [Vibrio cholerae]WLP78756.1 phospholipase D family protein [Vibrio cholerae]WLP78781.1 phospholipase D family protein [Vibrio cholerae]
MKIFDNFSDLEQLFDSVSNSKITIVSAFASGTESIIKKLATTNKVELIIGTINSFSSPKYIENLIELKAENLSLYMDFRYGMSTHWKLYLIEPDIVLIGSANFTSLGVSLKRDTLVRIDSEELYHGYISKVENLKSESLVLNSESKEFNQKFNLYRQSFIASQSANQACKTKSNLQTWLADDHNQAIPLFIWDSDIEPETYEQAFILIKDKEPEVKSKERYRLYTYKCKPNELPYLEGSLVITMNEKGSYATFERFDRIIYKDDVHYLYSFKGTRKKVPFDIAEIASGLKLIANELYGNEQTVLYRENIEKALGK